MRPHGKHDKRDSRPYRIARIKFLGRARATNTPCWLCGEAIDWQRKGRGTRAPELDHALPASTHPHLINEPSNFRVAHARCNQRRGVRTAEQHRERMAALAPVAPPPAWIPAGW